MAKTTVASSKNNPESSVGTLAPDMRVQEGELKKTEGVLYLGIDLGTSRTSVASSNGQRVTLSSHVGYPKDVVSMKLLKKDVLFGDEAVEHRLSLKFYRPLAACAGTPITA